MVASGVHHAEMIVCVIMVAAAITSTSAFRDIQDDVIHQRLREYFRCGPCDMSQCLPVRPDCAETALEHGVCACCEVCALTEGDLCGVYSPPCGSRLTCTPPRLMQNRADEVVLLFNGLGRCLPTEHNGVFDSMEPHQLFARSVRRRRQDNDISGSSRGGINSRLRGNFMSSPH